jgi:hypothetical protein
MRGDVSPSIDIHAEFFPVETTNARCNVSYLTISVAGGPDETHRNALEAAVRARGGRAIWRITPAARSYALLELPDTLDAAELPRIPGAIVYDGAVIAWAVFPTVAEALPYLYDALAGPGRPAGVLACRPCEGGAIVEWDPAVTPIGIVLRLMDVELRRFNSGRTAELLSPPAPAVLAQIAASGLRAPEIGEQRILELLIDDART